MLLYSLLMILCYSIGGTHAQIEYFPIRNLKSGMAVEVPNCDHAQEKRLITTKYHGGDDQLFYYGSNGSIVSKKCNKAIDVRASDCSNGENLIIWPAHGGKNQVFDVRDNGSIVNALCRKVIEMNGDDSNGAKIYLSPYNGDWTQKWDVSGKPTCREGRKLLEIDVTAGNKGAENTVSVKRKGKDGAWVKRKSLYHDGFDNNSMKKLTHCLHSEKCYKIVIKDKGGDGMTDGDGSYVIKVDSESIKDSEFEAGSKEETLYNC